MEWVGFLATLGLGCYCLWAAFGMTMFSLGFTGKGPPVAIIPALVAAVLFWFAYNNAPFAIVATQ